MLKLKENTTASIWPLNQASEAIWSKLLKLKAVNKVVTVGAANVEGCCAD